MYERFSLLLELPLVIVSLPAAFMQQLSGSAHCCALVLQWLSSAVLMSGVKHALAKNKLWGSSLRLGNC